MSPTLGMQQADGQLLRFELFPTPPFLSALSPPLLPVSQVHFFKNRGYNTETQAHCLSPLPPKLEASRQPLPHWEVFSRDHLSSLLSRVP